MQTVTPESVGLSADGLSAISSLMQDYVSQQKIAGVVTLVERHGQVAHLGCFGVVDIESNQPMQPDTLFRIQSMTKPITCAAMMMLFEEGCFQLHDPVSRFIPEFKDLKVFVKATDSGLELSSPAPEMTIYHLLTHTAGFVYDFNMPAALLPLYKQANVMQPDRTLAEMVRTLVKLPLPYQPGSTWQYGISHDVLGYLVQVISDMPFEDFLEQRIFKPLGMDDTAFYVPQEKVGRLSTLYGVAENGAFQVLDAPATSQYLDPSKLPSGGGGLVSTICDYLRFARMLLNGGSLEGVQILSPKTVILMTQNHLTGAFYPLRFGDFVSQGEGYGLGFGVIVDAAESLLAGSKGAYTWSGGASTHFWVDPAEQLIGIVMAQFQPMFFYPIEREFRSLVYQTIMH